MCRSNVIIYQNETKFEIYCNDKTESHHIIDNFLKVAINTITWVWTKSLIIHTVTFQGFSKWGKTELWLFFLWLFFLWLFFLWLFFLWLFFLLVLWLFFRLSFCHTYKTRNIHIRINTTKHEIKLKLRISILYLNPCLNE